MQKLKSRKLWAAVVGAALTTLGIQLDFPQEAVTGIVAIVVSYIVGQGIADAGANGGSQG